MQSKYDNILDKWLYEEIEDIACTNYLDEVNKQLKNPLTLKEFINEFHVEDILYFKAYGNKTMIKLHSDFYFINESIQDLAGKLMKLSHSELNKNIFLCMPKTKLFINYTEVTYVTENSVEFQVVSVPFVVSATKQIRKKFDELVKAMKKHSVILLR